MNEEEGFDSHLSINFEIIFNVEPNRAMLSKAEPGVKGDGNVDHPPLQAKHFSFNTQNGTNYIEIEAILATFAETWCFSQEKCPKTGALHWQGILSTKKKVRGSALAKRTKWFIEPTRNIDAAASYVTKAETHVDGPWEIPRKVKTIKECQLYSWQKEIITIIERPHEDRIIHWRWDPEGGSGKTEFCKYICVKYRALYCSGRRGDILFAASEKDYEIYCLDLARSLEDNVSYDAIECLENGIYFSTKYESKMVIRNRPHVLVFANFGPAIEKLSIDRWRIKRITHEEA